MSLFEQWKDQAYTERNQEDYNNFWKEYLLKEQKNYESILANGEFELKGSLKELGEKYGMDAVTFTGFLDGINTSFEEELDLDSLTEDTALNSTINKSKLYYNMLDAKADWLYNLPEWDAHLSVDERKDIKKQYNKDHIVVKEKKVGRNEPCPCGSGKKYKQCCLNK